MPLQTTHLHCDSRFPIGAVDPRLFGGFAEHMGRCIYEGLYDPKSKHADAFGFRTDTQEALRQLRMPVVRYPGGNFASGYDWKDGIGPKENRPVRRDLAWHSYESNQVGTDEFMGLCQRMGWTPMMTANLGLGSPKEALEWFEYCNAPRGTGWGDLRPQDEPYHANLWCLGNEMDGPWQLGHVPAEVYARQANVVAKLYKDADKGIETVASGSSNFWMPDFGKWDQKVLEILGDNADYISLHLYVNNNDDDTPSFLASGLVIDRQIEVIDAVCRTVQGQLKSKKRAYLCFDEWNVWYKNMQMDGKWQHAPHLIEEVYNLEDALVVAGFFNSFLRHADVLKIACIAQVVNIIAPLITRGDEMLVQSIWHIFRMYSERRDGVSLRVHQTGPMLPTKKFGDVSALDTSVVLGEDRVHLFAVNRSLTDSAPIQFSLGDRDFGNVLSAEIVHGTDPKAANSFENQNAVRAVSFSGAQIEGNQLHLELPPLSSLAISVSVQ